MYGRIRSLLTKGLGMTPTLTHSTGKSLVTEVMPSFNNLIVSHYKAAHHIHINASKGK